MPKKLGGQDLAEYDLSMTWVWLPQKHQESTHVNTVPPGAAAGKLCGGKLIAPFVQAASAGLLAGPAGAVAGGVAGDWCTGWAGSMYVLNIYGIVESSGQT